MTELPDKVLVTHGPELKIRTLRGSTDYGLVESPWCPPDEKFIVDVAEIMGESRWRRLRSARYASVGLVDPLLTDYPPKVPEPWRVALPPGISFRCRPLSVLQGTPP